jgi:hypothetical protein
LCFQQFDRFRRAAFPNPSARSSVLPLTRINAKRLRTVPPFVARPELSRWRWSYMLSGREPMFAKTLIQEAAALASLALFIAMIAIWTQVLGNL